jgi:mono/diheme cytochrome c family protein
MMRLGWTTLLCGCMLAGRAGDAAGQEPGGSPARSTMGGVYTAEQARKGQELFGGLCRSCHTSPAHTPDFKGAWTGRLLSGLFEFIQSEMPKDNPGTLTAQEVVLMLAYTLNALGMPAGDAELPADAAALAQIRIDTVLANPRSHVGETKP